MARIRSLKPEFFTHEGLGALSPFHRLAFEGLWCQADREGRLEDRPKRLKLDILPYDTLDFDQLLTDLAAEGFIVRYAVEGTAYLAIPTFLEHQRPNLREPASTIPPRPGPTTPPQPPDSAQEDAEPVPGMDAHVQTRAEPCAAPPGMTGKGKGKGVGNGKGKETRPPSSLRSDGPPARLDSTPAPEGVDRTRQPTRARAKRTPETLTGVLAAWFHGVFWPLYPWKLAKDDAERALVTLNPDEATRQAIVAAVTWQRRYGCLAPATGRDGRPLRLYPATYLNRRRWTDARDEPPPEPDETGALEDDPSRYPTVVEVPEGTDGAEFCDGGWMLQIWPDDPRHPAHRPGGQRPP